MNYTKTNPNQYLGVQTSHQGTLKEKTQKIHFCQELDSKNFPFSSTNDMISHFQYRKLIFTLAQNINFILI